MTVNITKPAINLREKLSELDFAKLPFQKMPAGSVVQVVTTNQLGNNVSAIAADGSTITETTAYNNSSLPPLIQTTITPKLNSSHFLVSLTGRFSISNGARSQILLSSNWVAGTSAVVASTFIWYSHYGLYNVSGGDVFSPGAFSYNDTSQNKAAGDPIIYSWFGGSIGGTQKYVALSMTVMEIAQ